jgi:hypothetical protein
LLPTTERLAPPARPEALPLPIGGVLVAKRPASGSIRKIDGRHSKKLLDKLERSVVREGPLQEIC